MTTQQIGRTMVQLGLGPLLFLLAILVMSTVGTK